MMDFRRRLHSACVVFLLLVLSVFPQVTFAANSVTQNAGTQDVVGHNGVANNIDPFFSFNQSPVIQIHGLPAIESAGILAKGRIRYRLVNNLASNYTFNEASNESLLFDGETSRSTFVFSQGVDGGLEWGIQIPYINHDPGTLDSFIDDWHDSFALPQGGRDSAPRGRLIYRYQRNGITEFALSNRSAGIGDVRMKAGWQLPAVGNEGRVAFRAALSLPTGDSDELRGSGAPELALWAAAERNEQWFSYPGSLFGGGGMLFMGKGKILPDQQRRVAVFGSLGAGMQVLSWMTLKLQADLNSSLYDGSAFEQINATAVQLLMGGDLQLAKNVKLSLMVSEDITVHASPDVVFQLGLVVE